jgi:UDP-N-acetylmuramoylalanine--D-glutamate ligase
LPVSFGFVVWLSFVVLFYNDSFSTTPETTIAAIQSFTEPLILIVGGSEKQSDFTELGRVIALTANIKALIMIGVTAPRILDAINHAGGFKGRVYSGAVSILEIMDQIKSIAQRGDVVLLSPACASFGMFKNYKDRGDQFTLAAAHFTLE